MTAERDWGVNLFGDDYFGGADDPAPLLTNRKAKNWESPDVRYGRVLTYAERGHDDGRYDE